jgi:hypothetical protein
MRIAGGASKPGKRHRHCAKQRCDVVSAPVLQVAFSVAGRAARPPQPMAAGLRGNDRSLNARQKLARFWQSQTQARNIAKTVWPADLCQIGAQATGIIPCRNQPQHPTHFRSPGRLPTRPTVPPVSSYPQSLDTPPVVRGIATSFTERLATAPSCRHLVLVVHDVRDGRNGRFSRHRHVGIQSIGQGLVVAKRVA